MKVYLVVEWDYDEWLVHGAATSRDGAQRMAEAMWTDSAIQYNTVTRPRLLHANTEREAAGQPAISVPEPIEHGVYAWTRYELPDWYRDASPAVTGCWEMHPGIYSVYEVEVGNDGHAIAPAGHAYLVTDWGASAWHVVGAHATPENAKRTAEAWAWGGRPGVREAEWDMEPPTEFISHTERGVTSYYRLRGEPIFVYEVKVAA